jgi:hypothetical protein
MMNQIKERTASSVAVSASMPRARETADIPTAHRSAIIPLLAWVFLICLAMISIAFLKAPDPVPATAVQGQFSAERAMDIVRKIAQAPHTNASSADDAVRQYLISQLSSLGMQPQVFAAMGIHAEGSAVVAGNTLDVLGRWPGTANSGAIMLMAHYDSAHTSPGAADDASGIAAILEAIRALHAGPPLKNDVIVLFTEGEEPGLLGAEAFAARHPWLKDVGLILNFEARGQKGPSLLFETSANNRPLIESFAQVAPHPIGSSLFYNLYELLPNDTDFSVFRRLQIPGFNFAFGAGLEAYHSALDVPARLSEASLQHHGSYALTLTRYFGQLNLKTLPRNGGDDVFFDWFGSEFVSYSRAWVVPLQIAATVLLLVLLAWHLRKREIAVSRQLLAFVYCVGFMLVLPLLLALTNLAMIRAMGGRFIFGDTPANAWLLIGYVLLGGAIAALAASTGRRITLPELPIAGLAVFCLVGWVAAIALPSGSYLFCFPLLSSTVVLLATIRQQQKLHPIANIILGLVGPIFAVLLYAPLIYLFYVYLPLQPGTVAAVGALLGLFFLSIFSVPEMAMPKGWPRRGVTIALFVLALGSLAVGVELSHASAEHPRRDSVVYSMNANDGTSEWISYDSALDNWTQQFFSKSGQQPHAVPDHLAGSQRPVFSAPAPSVRLFSPVAEIEKHDAEAGVHTLQMTVKSLRNANALYLVFARGIQAVSLKIGDIDVPVTPVGPLRITLLGLPAAGARLQIVVKSNSDISFWIMDKSFQLPVEIPPRPDNIIGNEASDMTLVCRRYQL